MREGPGAQGFLLRPLSAPKYVISYAQETGCLKLAEAASKGDPDVPGPGLMLKVAAGEQTGGKSSESGSHTQCLSALDTRGPQHTDVGLQPRNTWIRGPPWPAAQQLSEADELTFD